MRIRKITAGLLGGVMAASILVGCGGINKDEVVATFNDQEITLGVANFAARLQQATYDDFYTMYFGEKSGPPICTDREPQWRRALRATLLKESRQCIH